MEKLIQMKRDFAALTKQLRDAEAEASPDRAKVDRICEEIRSLAGKIEAEEAILRMTDGADGTEGPKHRANQEGDKDKNPRSREEYRTAFEKYVRYADAAELRSMTVGTPGKGGYLVPTDWEKAIVQKRHELSVMRMLADVQTTSLDKEIPVEGTEGVSTWIDEEGEYLESDEGFDQKVMNAYKYGRIIKVSEELLEDEQYDLQGYLTKKGARSNAVLEEAAFVDGDGTKKPRGFLLDSEVGKETAVTTGFTYDEILDLWGSLKSGYAKMATWLMKRGTLVSVMKLKDGDGRYLYMPSTLPGQLGAILDRPVVLADNMPAVALGAKPIAFGDFSYYRIQDRSGVLVQRLNELYAKNGQVGFRFRQRTDGKLLVADAIKVLQIKAV
jgi:HK97 family phage major capsid protein